MTEKMDSIKLPEDSPSPRRRRTYSRKPRLNASEQDLPRSSEQKEEIQVLSGKDQQEIEVNEVKEKDDHLNQMSAIEITTEVPDQTVGLSESSISHRVKAFMHPSEQEFADLLDYYQIPLPHIFQGPQHYNQKQHRIFLILQFLQLFLIVLVMMHHRICYPQG